jgi:hypothetical protein
VRECYWRFSEFVVALLAGAVGLAYYAQAIGRKEREAGAAGALIGAVWMLVLCGRIVWGHWRPGRKGEDEP